MGKSKIQCSAKTVKSIVTEISVTDGEHNLTLTPYEFLVRWTKNTNYQGQCKTTDSEAMILREPLLRPLFDCLFKKWKSVIGTGKTSSDYNGYTIIQTIEFYCKFFRKNSLKEIAEAETPLELNRFFTQMYITLPNYTIQFGGITSGTIPHNVNPNDAIDPKLWKKVRKAAAIEENK